jgi:hypothetical protein
VYNAAFSDESRASHSNFEYRPVDLRTPALTNTLLGTLYAGLSRSRYLADSVSDRLAAFDGPAAASDARIARTLDYAGYSYVLLGESMCSAPLNGGVPITPDSLFALAISRFDQAVTVATAAKAAAAGSAALSADSLINLARVGAARAALDRGEMSRAIGYASLVPAAFEFRVYYDKNAPTSLATTANPFWDATGSPELNGKYNFAAAWLSVDTTFQNMSDPRVPTTPTRGATIDPNGGQQYMPYQPESFGEWTGTLPGIPFTRGTSIRFASGLEARYVVAEAQGPTAATLALVNERRAVGNQSAVALSGDPLMAELRDQRRRDFYLDGRRLGDMRRYKKLYGVDLFVADKLPVSTTGQTYSTNSCWPIPQSEINGNPNVPQP